MREQERQTVRDTVEEWVRPLLSDLNANVLLLQSDVHRLKTSFLSATEKARADKIQHVVRSWRHRHTSRAFDGWRDLVHTERAAAIKRAVARWANRLFASCWASWRECVAVSRRAKELQRRSMMRLAHGLSCTVFWTWAEHVAAIAARRKDLLVSFPNITARGFCEPMFVLHDSNAPCTHRCEQLSDLHVDYLS